MSARDPGLLPPCWPGHE